MGLSTPSSSRPTARRCSSRPGDNGKQQPVPKVSVARCAVLTVHLIDRLGARPGELEIRVRGRDPRTSGRAGTRMLPCSSRARCAGAPRRQRDGQAVLAEPAFQCQAAAHWSCARTTRSTGMRSS
jgi:hypothetical protein